MRRIIAELSLNEEVAEKETEMNGWGEYEPIPYISHELGWLEPSGIQLCFAYIADADDVEARARYINYIFEWAQCRAEDFERTDSPLSYDEWLEIGEK